MRGLVYAALLLAACSVQADFSFKKMTVTSTGTVTETVRMPEELEWEFLQ